MERSRRERHNRKDHSGTANFSPVRPSLDELRHWEGFQATWPVMIVAQLRRKLPADYFAEPRVHSGAAAKIDVATFEDQSKALQAVGDENKNGGGLATVVWAPPLPTLSVATDLPDQDVYEVLVYNEKRRCRLTAAIEIMSPVNKDRPEHQCTFAARCAALLRERVSVIIVDPVTTRSQNLYKELLELPGLADFSSAHEMALYATACRLTKRDNQWLLETWVQALDLGEPLPTIPLWLSDTLAILSELDESYEQSCAILNLP